MTIGSIFTDSYQPDQLSWEYYLRYGEGEFCDVLSDMISDVGIDEGQSLPERINSTVGVLMKDSIHYSSTKFDYLSNSFSFAMHNGRIPRKHRNQVSKFFSITKQKLLDVEKSDDQNSIEIFVAACVDKNAETARSVLPTIKNIKSRYFGGTWRDYKKGWTLLHAACYLGDVELVEQLINCGADISSRDDKLRTPLHIACAKGNLDVVRKIAVSDNPNVLNLVEVYDEDQYSPLLLATENHNSNVVEYLLELGAGKNEQDAPEDAPFPYTYALRYGNVDSVKAYEQYGFEELLGPWDSPIHDAALNPDNSVIDHVLSKGADINSLDLVGRDKPIFDAILAKNFPVTEYLLEHGADATGAIHKLIAHDFSIDDELFLKFLNLLLSYDVDIDEKDESGNTLLYKYMCQDHETRATMLVVKGANIHEKIPPTSHSKVVTPMEVAEERGLDNFRHILYQIPAYVYARKMSGRGSVWDKLQITSYTTNTPFFGPTKTIKKNRKYKNKSARFSEERVRLLLETALKTRLSR